MAYEISLSKKSDKAGRAELLIKLRLGSINQRAKTGLFVFTKHVREESYMSSKGRPSTRLVIVVPRLKNPEAAHTEEVKRKLDELIAHIDSQLRECDTKNLENGWLVEVVKSFSEETPPPQSEKTEPTSFSISSHFETL